MGSFKPAKGLNWDNISIISIMFNGSNLINRFNTGFINYKLTKYMPHPVQVFK